MTEQELMTEQEPITEQEPMAEQEAITEPITEQPLTEQPTVETDIFAEDAALEETLISPESETENDLRPVEDFFETEEPVRRRRGFKIFLSIFTVLLLVAVTVALWLFQSALDKYESNMEEPPLQAYLDLIGKNDYETLFAVSGFQETELNSKEDYIAYLKSRYENAGELSVVEQVTADRTIQRFNVYSNGTDKLATLLVTSESGKDGKTTWYVTTELEYQPAYTVTASSDVDLYINGTAADLLSSASVTVSEIQTAVFDFPTELTLPVIKTYTVSGLLLPPEVEAIDLSGKACVRDEEGNNLVLMLADDDNERSVHEALATGIVTSQFQTDTETLREMTVSDYRRYSESDFSCTVTCTEFTTSEDGILSEEGSAAVYEMTFLESDSTWVLCSLTVDGVKQAIPRPAAGNEPQS